MTILLALLQAATPVAEGGGGMPGWVGDMAKDLVGVFLGAALGAAGGGYIGYRYSKKHARESIEALRATLFQAISDQLHHLPETTPSYDPANHEPFSMYHISAASQMLNGSALSPQRDATLIFWLVELLAVETRYQETVRYSNDTIINALTIPKMGPIDALPYIYHNISIRHQKLRDVGQAVLAQLPPEYQGKRDMAFVLPSKVKATAPETALASDAN